MFESSIRAYIILVSVVASGLSAQGANQCAKVLPPQFATGTVLRQDGYPPIILSSKAIPMLQLPRNDLIDSLGSVTSQLHREHEPVVAASILAQAGLPTLRYPVDPVAIKILEAVQARLARRIDAHRFPQGMAKDFLDVPGLGTLKVQIAMIGGSIFYIQELEGPGFHIRNTRLTGRYIRDPQTGMTTWSDAGLPYQIKINELDTDLRLDDRGIYLYRRGHRYTNLRTYTHGGGYSSDSQRDQLYLDTTKLREKLKLSPQGEDWFKDGPAARLSEAFHAQVKVAAEIATSLPFEASLRKECRDISTWLTTHVLEPLTQLPEVENQVLDYPPLVQVPDEYSRLHLWLGKQKYTELWKKLSNPQAVPADTDFAVHFDTRLIPLGSGGAKAEDVPSIAYDGFVYLSLERDFPDTGGFHSYYRRRSILEDSFNEDSPKQLVEVHLQNAEDVYVLDEDAGFAEDGPYYDMSAVARTLIPLIDYKDQYAKPVVVMRRNLELSEIVPFPRPAWVPNGGSTARTQPSFLPRVMRTILSYLKGKF